MGLVACSKRMLPPVARASAELRAAELTLTYDLTHNDIAGLAVDWSEWYDHVLLAMGLAAYVGGIWLAAPGKG